MYLHQPMKDTNKYMFQEVMTKDLTKQTDTKIFDILLRREVPHNSIFLPAVWKMKCKCEIVTHKVYKYNEGLIVDGSYQIKGYY